MREPNARVRPRDEFQLSLDGRQVASVVVAALVILGVVFVLGLNVGKQIALRRAAMEVAGDLDALDRAPAPAAPAKEEPLTFHEELTRPAPAASPPAAAAPPPPSAPAPAPASPSPATAPPPPVAAPPTASPPDEPWTVQLAASQDRAEAERLAARFAALNPRVEEADVPGKGRFWRVRVGAFDTREAADRYLRDVARETGAKGFVTPTR